MAHEIVMPRLSETTDEGVLVTWFVEPGSAVREGDLVAEVQVEKAAAEVRSPAAGRVGTLLAEPGGVVRQGDRLTTIETGDADSPTMAEGARQSDELGPPLRESSAAPPSVVASPAAKRLARELGVDIATVSGTGPGGRIQEADIRAAAESDGPPAAESQAQPLSSRRRIIADRLRSGLATTAQLTLTAEADVTDLAARLAGGDPSSARRTTWTDVAVRASAIALREHPRLAARLTPDGLVAAASIDIGVAVALDEALIVPVVRDPASKTMDAIGRDVADLAERARTGRLEVVETQGGCFTVTNLGASRIDAFTPLLNPPQTAILGLGRARLRPAVVDGAIVPRMLLVLSLTFDHQVVDGAPAAAFLGTIVELLESPDRLFD